MLQIFLMRPVRATQALCHFLITRIQSLVSVAAAYPFACLHLLFHHVASFFSLTILVPSTCQPGPFFLLACCRSLLRPLPPATGLAQAARHIYAAPHWPAAPPPTPSGRIRTRAPQGPSHAVINRDPSMAASLLHGVYFFHYGKLHPFPTSHAYRCDHPRPGHRTASLLQELRSGAAVEATTSISAGERDCDAVLAPTLARCAPYVISPASLLLHALPLTRTARNYKADEKFGNLRAHSSGHRFVEIPATLTPPRRHP